MRCLDFLGFPRLYWLPTCERSIRTRQDASNVPAVEPSLADAKPADAAEAVEVPWTCGRLMRNATNDGIKYYKKEREVFFCSIDD